VASCLGMDTSFLPVMANAIVCVHKNTFDERLVKKKRYPCSVHEIVQQMNVSSGYIDAFMNAFILEK